MRKADLVMAILVAAFSVYLLVKSTELPVTWVDGIGPGGGMFPFWLSLGMLVCSMLIIVRWVMKASPVSRLTDTFFDKHALQIFITISVALFLFIASIHVIGVYGAIPLFLAFYLRFFGNHRWLSIGLLAATTPTVMFFLFEIAMRITLPKGYTEPLFFPLYDVFL